MDEKILGTIPDVNLRKGFFKNIPLTIVVTDKRIIFAKVTRDVIRREKDRKRKELEEKGEGKKFLKIMEVYHYLHEHYLDMNPEDILKESQGNFYLNLEEIKTFKIKRPKPQWHSYEEIEFEDPNILLINTSSGEKLKFEFGSSYDNARRLFSKALNRKT